MGSSCSRVGRQEQEAKQLTLRCYRQVFEKENGFTKAEMERLFSQFWTMAYKPDMKYYESRLPILLYADLLKYTDTRNPLHERIILAFMASKARDQMHLSRLDFPSFVKRMAIFLPSTPAKDKLEFIFRVYDTYDNEVLNVGDVKALLVELHGDDMTEDHRDFLSREFLKDFGDELHVTKESFVKTCAQQTPVNNMIIRFS